MSQRKADLILHPVRLRIVTELAGRQFSPRQLAELLPDVAQATLYRQLSLLLEGGVIEIAAEHSVNGATERIYRVAEGQRGLSMEEVREFSSEDHLRYFTIFAASLIDTFAVYLQNTEQGELHDDLSYNRAVVYLNDEERAQFRQDVAALIGKIIANEPASNRKRYTLASIVIPDRKETK